MLYCVVGTNIGDWIVPDKIDVRVVLDDGETWAPAPGCCVVILADGLEPEVIGIDQLIRVWQAQAKELA